MKKETSVDQLLRELEDDSITNNQKADILATIIDIESENPEADVDLIQECFDYLELLKNSEEEITARKERIPYHLQRSYQKAADETAPFKSLDFSKIQQHPPVRKRRIHTIGLAAAIFVAILLITVTSLTVIARVNGYGSMWEWLSAHLNEYFQLDHGEQMTIEDITVIRNTGSQVYPNIETWLKEENLDMLYPSVLPEGIRLDHITQSTLGDGKVSITLVFNTPEVSFEAQNYDLALYEILEGMEVIEANEYRFGILYTPEIDFAYHAYCIVDNFAYGIGCQDRDTLLILINHLKGIES